MFEIVVKDDEISEGILDNADCTLLAIFVIVVINGEIYEDMADGNEDIALNMLENRPGT